MTFPDTLDEFLEQYQFKDEKEVYTNGSMLIPVFRVKQWAEHIPAVDAVEVRHGHWVRHYDDDIGRYTCSECGEEIWNPDIEREKYCWNFGAKMDGCR
jgi:hypothetical protein